MNPPLYPAGVVGRDPTKHECQAILSCLAFTFGTYYKSDLCGLRLNARSLQNPLIKHPAIAQRIKVAIACEKQAFQK
ncbi:hypothetical protein H6F50_09375 [Coleofasciculus sp. FACHB-712]|uniref:hypothetical protein n=1 Tax=Coleofasciculus sp. FACHB-712 TaxID=2692789 RepID=UPI001683B9CF|nr:hypothetical protein [Coleofasciculus sp. FACHB-712]MBD1942563.1 hypothetical protein [Coleofasciculus sp. FACHB-712]